ncbi:MAG: PepSY-like domain-containing protein [Bacteroidales bacterium]|nr:PepSY-like domain-containing protein [Bacteroidales bacterium]
MKAFIKIPTIYATLIVSTLMAFSACAGNDRPAKLADLPNVAQTFVKKYFTAEKPMLVTIDKEVTGNTYEVKFASGNSVDFDRRGEWTEVECRPEVSAAIVPTQIIKLVQNNYPEAKIIKIDRDRRGYEVELSTRLELKFDNDFNLVDIDN